VPAAGRQGGLNNTAFSSLPTGLSEKQQAALRQSIRQNTPSARDPANSQRQVSRAFMVGQTFLSAT